MPVISTGNYEPTLVRKVLDFPEAIALAETELLKHDLTESRNIAHILQSRQGLPFSVEDSLIATSLYRTALMLWVTCFDKPHQGDLDRREVYTGNDLSFFESCIDVRNSYIAHRHGPQRQSATVAVLNIDRTLHSTQQGTTKYIRPGPNEMANMVRLIEIAIGVVEARAKTQSDAVSAVVREMEPAALSALKDFEVTPPDETQTRLSRKAFREQLRSPQSEPRKRSGSGGPPKKGRRGR